MRFFKSEEGEKVKMNWCKLSILIEDKYPNVGRFADLACEKTITVQNCKMCLILIKNLCYAWCHFASLFSFFCSILLEVPEPVHTCYHPNFCVIHSQT